MAKDKKAKSTDKKSKSKGEAKELTPLQKAHLARKNGTAKKKPKKKAGPVFKAPEGTKPFFVEAILMFDKDGLFTDMSATRIKGNAKNPDAKRVDLAAWDPTTHRRMAIRFAGASFVRNEGKRLAAGSQAKALFRIAIARDTGAVKVGLKEVKYREGKDGKAKTLDKKNPVYRAIRKPVKFMAAAFTKLKDFPSAADLKALNKTEE
jgi:hypothetical protein